MVKVLHFADLHLGVENYGHLDPATGLHSRLLDFMRSFDELVEYALREPVDLVLFAGDAYKSRTPNPTHQREFARRIYRLASANIPVFLLTGNHDIPSTLGRANTLDIFATLEIPNVYIGRKPTTYLVPTRAGNVQIVALPWIVRSHLLSRNEYKNRSLSEIEDLMLSKIENILNTELAALDPSLPTILTVHGTVQGAHYGSERSVMLGQELVLPSSLLNNPAFDYVALGHIHRYQQLGQNPPIIYSGSLDRIDFGEEGETKGFVLAEVEKGKTKTQFVELKSTRRFITIKVQATGTDPMAQVRKAITAHNIRDAIIRLVIHTTIANNQLLRDNEIHSLLSEAYKVATIVREVERPSRPRLGSNRSVEQMTPLEALEKYLQIKQIAKDRTAKLLQYAERLINSGTYEGKSQ